MERYEFELDDITKTQRGRLKKEAALYEAMECDDDGAVVSAPPVGNSTISSGDGDGDGDGDGEDAAAAVDRKPACSVTLRDIEVRYGFGMFVYFDFVRLFFFLNCVIMIPCLPSPPPPASPSKKKRTRSKKR